MKFSSEVLSGLTAFSLIMTGQEAPRVSTSDHKPQTHFEETSPLDFSDGILTKINSLPVIPVEGSIPRSFEVPRSRFIEDKIKRGKKPHDPIRPPHGYPKKYVYGRGFIHNKDD